MFLLEEPLTNQAFRFFSSKGLRGQILAIFRGGGADSKMECTGGGGVACERRRLCLQAII